MRFDDFYHKGSLSTGTETLDEQHRLLDGLSKRVVLGYVDGIEREDLLERLDTFVTTLSAHFTDEETAMVAQNHPRLEAHRKDHRVILSRFDDVRQEVTSKGVNSPQLFLDGANHMVRHIITHDKPLPDEAH